MRITQLTANNVKRLEAVSIAPDGNLVVIGGKNGAGKSSVLDSILYTLSGAGSLPGKPVRTGQDSAESTVTLSGDPPLIVHRKIRADGKTSLEVLQDLGGGVTSTIKSPQKMLDSLIGRIAFDPLEFTRQKPQQQIETLRSIVGVNTSEIDSRLDQLTEDRAVANREVKRLTGVVESLPTHDGVPNEEQSAADVMKELKEANEHNTRVDNHFAVADSADRVVGDWESEVERRQHEVDQIKNQLERAITALSNSQKSLADARSDAATKRTEAELLDKIDTAHIEAKLSTLESTNAKVRENKHKAAMLVDLEVATEAANDFQLKIEAARREKVDAMLAAEWPVDGLGFGPDGVTFNDLPFDQCSSAEQLRISTAIGASQNPKLNVMFIRDGSLLDADSLAAVGEIAERYGSQVWIERVGYGEECSVIIEDGTVVETRSSRKREAVGA